MARILFSHSYFYRFDPKQMRIGEPFPPLMTITAASLMRQEGHEVKLFDVGLLESAGGLNELLLNDQPDYFVIFDDGFNWLTKMCLTTMREAAFIMQQEAKSLGIKVITCSSDSTDHYVKYLEHGADVVIRGEGEMTLKELIQFFENQHSIDQVAGIAYSENGAIKTTGGRQVMKQLDELPMAAWDLVDIQPYHEVWKSKNKIPHLNVATTRGCPYKCNWCAKPIYGNRYNTRSVSHVVDEIAFHLEHHQIDHFWMCDDIFGLKPGWVQDFRDELKHRKLKIHYKIQSRADLLLKEDTIDALVDSGLYEVWIGAESGSQQILDAMEKGTTIGQIEQATHLLKSKGVRVAFFIQYGYLGEEYPDIQNTLRMIRKLLPDSLGISVSYPLPGTGFHEKVKHDLQQKANWVDSDDLDMMFKNTYQPDFYRVLHTHTHHVFRRAKAWEAVTKWDFMRKSYWKDVLKVNYFGLRAIISHLKLQKLKS